jgi:hypothetical protein
MNNKLIFATGNSKLSKGIATFSLPAGHTCPFAKECLSKVNRLTHKIADGKHTLFRCFSASQECIFPTVFRARWHNLELLRANSTIEKMGMLIQTSLPNGFTSVRVHVSGDFYSERYFLSWLNVAYNNPLIIFYGYTKAIPFLVKYKKFIPNNFRFTASKGGTHDELIARHKLKYAEVVFSVAEATSKGLEIDHDDSHAYNDYGNFALLLHGIQPMGSRASIAMSALKKTGFVGYNKATKLTQFLATKKLEIVVTLKNGEIYLPRKTHDKQIKFMPVALRH